MFAKIGLFIVATVFVVSEAAYVDTLNKCKLADTSCTKDWLQKLLAEAAGGIPDIGMPPIDPLALTNVNIKILNDIDLTLNEGTVKGVKNCKVNEFGLGIENKNALVDLTCDVVIQGKYSLVSEAPLITALTGGKPIHGEGIGGVDIEKLNLKLKLAYDVIKKGEEYFINIKDDQVKYEYSGPDSLKFNADNVYIGDAESSAQVVELLNQNGKMLLGSFADGFFGEVLKIVAVYVHKFFDNVAVNNYIIDDVSPYA